MNSRRSTETTLKKLNNKQIKFSEDFKVKTIDSKLDHSIHKLELDIFCINYNVSQNNFENLSINYPKNHQFSYINVLSFNDSNSLTTLAPSVGTN